ncbi:acylneuraminate cytidylyltransferase family protein [uncultured Gemella sp.]|uniref:acylneuraminate cytidylyltransferase family protein n=1 Tax=uncultured Gemella sp. TaxID=254352 RepID=UPI0028D8E31E|nr:acylneuraminate cytidylyltransferase family protein [uncultured Gemella sp.]
MKKIAIILIRKNSKGLVDKNIKLFCGKPLCFYTIDIAINSGLFDEIWISSDSQVYLDICKEEYGEQCKYIIRNKEVAADSSTTYETLECLFNNIKEDFIFMNLQVTSPLRKIEHIKEVIKMFKDCDHIVSFSELKYSKSLFMNLNDGYLLPSRHGGDYRRQDEPINIYPNGSIWMSTKNNYLRDKTFYTKKTKVYEMEKIFSFDIDDEIDFYICEELYKNYILEN